MERGNEWAGPPCGHLSCDSDEWAGSACGHLSDDSDEWAGSSSDHLVRVTDEWTGSACDHLAESGDEWAGSACDHLARRSDEWAGSACDHLAQSNDEWAPGSSERRKLTGEIQSRNFTNGSRKLTGEIQSPNFTKGISDNSDHLALGTSESLSNNGVEWAGSACDHLHQDERAGYACDHLSYEAFKNDSETNCGGRCSPAVGFSTQISIDNPKADGSEEATSYSEWHHGGPFTFR